MDLRLPNITATTEREQIEQIKSYLYQLTSQLEWMFSTIGESGKAETSGDVSAIITAIKPVIAEASEIVSAHYDRMRPFLRKEFCSREDFLKSEEAFKSLEKRVSNNEEKMERSINLYHSFGLAYGKELSIYCIGKFQSIFIFGGNVYGTIFVDAEGVARFSGSEGVSAVSHSEGLITLTFSSDMNCDISALSAMPIQIA